MEMQLLKFLKTDTKMEKTTIDTHTLEHIPEEHRAKATSYEAPDGLWTQLDKDNGILPEGKNVGDVREAAHTRYTVTYAVAQTYNYS